MSTKNYIKIKNLSKSFGDVEVLKNINLEVEEGEFFSLLGPSGCGKTTLLRILANILSKVVFPHPDGPSSEKNSPSSTSRLMFFKTSTSPKLLDKFLILI